MHVCSEQCIFFEESRGRVFGTLNFAKHFRSEKCIFFEESRGRFLADGLRAAGVVAEARHAREVRVEVRVRVPRHVRGGELPDLFSPKALGSKTTDSGRTC